jgi:hypothetical protein
MTYIKTFLPKYEDLIKIVEQNPNVINYYLKYDCLIGDTKSIDFLNEKRNQKQNKL